MIPPGWRSTRPATSTSLGHQATTGSARSIPTAPSPTTPAAPAAPRGTRATAAPPPRPPFTTRLVAVGAVGNVYTRDTGNQPIRRDDAKASFRLRGQPWRGARQQWRRGPAGAVTLSGPYGVAVNPSATCTSPTRATTGSARWTTTASSPTAAPAVVRGTTATAGRPPRPASKQYVVVAWRRRLVLLVNCAPRCPETKRASCSGSQPHSAGISK